MGREMGGEEEGQPLKPVNKMVEVEVFSKEGEEEGFISKKKGDGEGGVKLKAEMTLMNGCTIISKD